MGAVLDFGWRCFYRCAYRGFVVYTWLARPRVRSAHVLVWWEDQLLMAGHSYKRGLSAPAGMIHRDEDPVLGAARELREEVGIQVAPADLRPVLEFDTRLERARDNAYVFAVELEAKPEIRIDNREIIWANFMSVEAIRGTELRPIFRHLFEQVLGGPPPAPSREDSGTA